MLSCNDDTASIIFPSLSIPNTSNIGAWLLDSQKLESQLPNPEKVLRKTVCRRSQEVPLKTGFTPLVQISWLQFGGSKALSSRLKWT
jgi:hypothetical protein